MVGVSYSDPSEIMIQKSVLANLQIVPLGLLG
jgi:hypothetical protein